MRRPQDRRQRAGSQQQDHWQRGPLSAGLETGLKWAIIVFYLILFLRWHNLIYFFFEFQMCIVYFEVEIKELLIFLRFSRLPLF